MFLFFDTETTGLPRNWQAPLEDLDNWPRLVQLAWLLMDENGKEVKARTGSLSRKVLLFQRKRPRCMG